MVLSETTHKYWQQRRHKGQATVPKTIIQHNILKETCPPVECSVREREPTLKSLHVLFLLRVPLAAATLLQIICPFQDSRAAQDDARPNFRYEYLAIHTLKRMTNSSAFSVLLFSRQPRDKYMVVKWEGALPMNERCVVSPINHCFNRTLVDINGQHNRYMESPASRKWKNTYKIELNLIPLPVW